jgi:hypothetical protein
MKNNPTFDLYVDENTDFDIALDLVDITLDSNGIDTIETPLDLSEVTNVSADVRNNFSDTSIVLFSFDCQLEDASTSNRIFLSIPKSRLTGLNLADTQVTLAGYYDVVLENSAGIVSKVLSGKIFINRTATRT